MTPGDVGLVINTHLHFEHRGHNTAFKHALRPDRVHPCHDTG